MSEFLVVLEKAEGNFAAFSPDLPGCVATGKTRAETLARMRRAIAAHIEGLRQDGLSIPEPSASAEYVAL